MPGPAAAVLRRVTGAVRCPTTTGRREPGGETYRPGSHPPPVARIDVEPGVHEVKQGAGAGAFYVLVAEDGSVLGRFNLYDFEDGTAVLGGKSGTWYQRGLRP